MQLEILTYPDERLREHSAEITEFTPELRELAQEMTKTMYENNGIGLAAPQVDHRIRLIVVDVSGPDERTQLMQLANPRIIAREGETEGDEGCLSVPNIRTIVQRSERVTVAAQNLDGSERLIEAEGLLAVCLQHEMDHLGGTLIVDHMSRLKRSMYDKKVKKWLKQRSEKN